VSGWQDLSFLSYAACTGHDVETVLVGVLKDVLRQDVLRQALLTSQTTKQIINNVPTKPYPNMLLPPL
jgi:hypothetical protein